MKGISFCVLCRCDEVVDDLHGNVIPYATHRIFWFTIDLICHLQIVYGVVGRREKDRDENHEERRHG